MNSMEWYATLSKPAWAPPSWLFGSVWTVLYIVIAVTFIMVFYRAWMKEIPFIIAVPFALNLVFNLLFTPLQFGLRNNILASVDILFIFATLVWALVAVYPYMRVVTFTNVPYLLWVCFATVLQLTITYLNVNTPLK
jgi:translocator protein